MSAENEDAATLESRASTPAPMPDAVTGGEVGSSDVRTTYVLSARDEELEQRVQADVNDADAWEELVKSVERDEATPMERVRLVFERVLAQYPLHGPYWVKYASLEIAKGDKEHVSDIFRRTLLTTTSVELWLTYLAWLKQTSMEAAGDDLDAVQRARTTIVEAFEEATKAKNVGTAVDAGPLWRAYIDFVVEHEPDTTQFEAGQKLTTLRKLYQRAIAVSVREVDVIWREYQAFEQSKGPITAKKLLEEALPVYTHAFEILKERDAVWRAVLPSTSRLPRPPNRRDPSCAVLESNWNRILDYARGNPEHLQPVDYKIRVRFAYRRALADLRFYPEIWFGFADFERSLSDHEASLAVLQESLHALPDSAILHFALADHLEQDGEIQQAKTVLDTLCAQHPSPSALIHRLQFARRCEGALAARSVFKSFRALFDVCDSSVYAAAADMEYRVNKSPNAARNIFELGLKKFPRDPLLVRKYVAFAQHSLDHGAARDIFERVVAALTSTVVGTSQGGAEGESLLLEVWLAYRAFARDAAMANADIAALVSIEKRAAAALPHVADLHGLASLAYRLCGPGQAQLPGRLSSCDATFVEAHPQMQRMSGMFDVPFSAMSKSALAATSSSSAATTAVPAAAAAQANGAAEAQEEARLLESMPASVRRLLSVLPRHLPPGSSTIDLDFVVRNLTKSNLPFAPIRNEAVGGGDLSSGSRKRALPDKLGVEDAPPDAFKQRQSKRART